MNKLITTCTICEEEVDINRNLALRHNPDHTTNLWHHYCYNRWISRFCYLKCQICGGYSHDEGTCTRMAV